MNEPTPDQPDSSVEADVQRPGSSESTEPTAPAAPPERTIVIQQAGGFLRFMAVVGWLGVLLCVPVIALLLFIMTATSQQYFDTTGGITERYHSLAKQGQYKVAVITVSGIIGGGDGFVKRQIDRVRSDKAVKAVVLRIDSPGGSVSGSDYMLHHLNQLRKDREIPIVVSMGGMAASGGFYVAMAVGDQTQSIFAEPTTLTGSIGVIVPHYDLSGLMERFDVKDDSIKSHPRKQMLSPTRPMSDEDREIVQQLVDEMFVQFKKVVKTGRPRFRADPEALDQLATGEVFTAGQAKRHGLVDELGFIEMAIDRAVELAKLDKKKTRVVSFKKPPTMIDKIGLPGSGPATLDPAALLELSTPRAYYLSTTLPILVRNRQ